jgi:uncharacterized protein (TIGR03435 family)
MRHSVFFSADLVTGLLVGAALLNVASSAQTSAHPAATPAPATTVATPLAFEVSTVKLSKSGNSGSRSSFQDGRFLASNVTLKNILEYDAYRIPESRILGGPKWLSSERFDIEAKTNSDTAERLRNLDRDQRRIQTQAMFQQLLSERFKLTAHWETREQPVYVMVAASKGPHLHPSKEQDGHSGTHSNNGELTAQGITMAQLADTLTQELQRELGRVVIDKTGIQGRYDCALKWNPDTGAPQTNDGTDASATSGDAGPSIFTAIQEQLGLKLESSKAPVQVLVVDRAELPSQD